MEQAAQYSHDLVESYVSSPSTGHANDLLI